MSSFHLGAKRSNPYDNRVGIKLSLGFLSESQYSLIAGVFCVNRQPLDFFVRSFLLKEKNQKFKAT